LRTTIRKLEGPGGIGFDDLWFAPRLRRVLVPAGGTGRLDLVNPDDLSVTSIPGFGVAPGGYEGGHEEGTTSADEGGGFLFAIDRTSQSVKIVDASAARVVAMAPLEGGPDYVRWVEGAREVWVTEPDREQIEVFALGAGPQLSRVTVISVPGGPESLVIDAKRGLAFSHLWAGRSVRIRLSSRTVEAAFANGCQQSRGIALDSARGLLFAGCAEGKAVVLDIDHAGKQLSFADSASGVDIISYNSRLRHLYVPAASTGVLAIFGVSGASLSPLARVATAVGTHCVIADDRDRAWVCDPKAGRLWMVEDSLPASP
jgi:hypothetical protein